MGKLKLKADVVWMSPAETLAYRVFRDAARDLLAATESAKPIIKARQDALQALHNVMTTPDGDVIAAATAAQPARLAAESVDKALTEKQATFRAAMQDLTNLAAPPIK